MKNIIKKIEKTIPPLIKKQINKVFEEETIPEIKRNILDNYNSMLNDKVVNRRSRTRPEDYMEDFNERLEDFEYVAESSDEVSLIVPDIDNFDFSGRLKILKNILEGVTGVYVEIDEEQYEKMYGKPPRLLEPFDSTVRKKDRIYLLRITGDLRRRMKENRIEYVRYPFSNTPSIDIFESTDEYVEKELLDKAIDKATEGFVKTFRV